jgi:hypothetical protein
LVVAAKGAVFDIIAYRLQNSRNSFFIFYTTYKTTIADNNYHLIFNSIGEHGQRKTARQRQLSAHLPPFPSFSFIFYFFYFFARLQSTVLGTG